jgi:DNA-binding CsgD family transcriptional regulator
MAATADSPGAFLCPVLVGRDRQLGTFGRLIEFAAAGSGQVALISGEAGSGKSRLAREVAAMATALRPPAGPFRAISGAAFEHTARSPFWLAADALAMAFEGQPPRDVAATLGPAAPDAGRLIPSLGLPNPGPPPSNADERQRMVETVARAFVALSRPQPLVVTFEDLHWADEGSLDLVLSLARLVPRNRMLLVLTYRDDEAGPALRHLLGELERARIGVPVSVERLKMRDVEGMLLAMPALSGRVQAGLLQAVYALSEGNPFAVEETVKALQVSGGDRWWEVTHGGGPLPVPQSLDEAVRRRVDRLSEDAQEVLRVAAVAGRRFDFDLLSSVTGRSEGALVAAVRDLVAAQLVVEESPDRFAFRHALTREAVYRGLLGREQRRLHGLVAEAIEGGSGDYSAAEKAQHWYRAGGWTKAANQAVTAAREAAALYSFGPALQHYDMAVEAAGRGGMALPAAILLGRGQVREIVGEREAARADYEEAIRVATQSGEAHTACEAFIALGLLHAGDDYAAAGACYQRALVLAGRSRDPVLRAKALNRMGNWYVNRERPADGIPCHEQALELYRRAGDRPGIAETLDLLGMARVMGGDPEGSVGAYRGAIAILEELGDRPGIASALGGLCICGNSYLSVTLPLSASSREECEAAARRGLDLTQALGWRAGEAYQLAFLANILGSHGDYAAALEAVDSSLAIATSIGHPQWLVAAETFRGQILVDLLDPGRALAGLEVALARAKVLQSEYWVHVASGVLAQALVAEGDLDEAARILGSAGWPDLPMTSIGQRLVWAAALGLLLARGQPAEAASVAARLATSAPGPGGRPTPWLLWQQGRALAAMDDLDGAMMALDEAIAAAAGAGLRPLTWRARVSAAQAAQAAGQRSHAREHEREARRMIDELTAATGDRERAVFRDAALALLTPPARARHALDLSPREREVAALVAQGMTNRQIGEALVLSERTVESHIASALAKLGQNSRSALAAWWVREGEA